MPELITEIKIHGQWAAQEDALLLDLDGRYVPKSKLLTKFITDRNSSQIESRRHAILMNRMDVILSNSGTMMCF
jgi:hypothetical protein